MQDTSTSDNAQETQMLRESAADFVQRSADMKRLRERRGTLPGHDAGTVRQMAELGWFGILVPEAQGGLGLGFAEMSVMLQELGKGLMADPLVPTVLATRVLHHAGHDALAARLLPGVADASALPCVAWQEDLGGLDPGSVSTQARPNAGGGVVLDGTKRFIAGAAGACGFIVSARSDANVGLYWVPAGAPGATLRHEWRADETPSGVLELAAVAVPAADVICAPGAAAVAALERAADEAAVMASAEMLGVVEAALQMALGYMRTRVQFGKPIGSFQALQHKATDLYVQQELVRAVLDDAVRALDGGEPAAAQAQLASRCKSRSSDAGLRVTREVIQLHGAIGYTDEYDAGLYLKRALVLSAWLGNATAHRKRFSRLTGGTVTL
jgi:alkylation response protein AidB-like acyl-CoA dehydrogenase